MNIPYKHYTCIKVNSIWHERSKYSILYLHSLPRCNDPSFSSEHIATASWHILYNDHFLVNSCITNHCPHIPEGFYLFQLLTVNYYNIFFFGYCIIVLDNSVFMNQFIYEIQKQARLGSETYEIVDHSAEFSYRHSGRWCSITAHFSTIKV